MSFIWIGLIITLTLIEFLTNNLITIWYVLSAIIALVLSLFIDSYLVQFIIFSVIGTILLLFFRDNFSNILKKRRENLLLDKIAIVCEELTKKKNGKVKIGYRKYNASANKKIKKDKHVKIIGINGYTLKVEEVKK